MPAPKVTQNLYNLYTKTTSILCVQEGTFDEFRVNQPHAHTQLHTTHIQQHIHNTQINSPWMKTLCSCGQSAQVDRV